MKRYYFYPRGFIIAYSILLVYLIFWLVALCVFVDEIHSGAIFCIVVLSLGILSVLTWTPFCAAMCVQIDHSDEEIKIIHIRCIKKIKFCEIKSVEIVEYSAVEFSFLIVTSDFSKRIVYTRYSKKKPTPKILAKVEEVKDALRSIPISNQ